MPFNIVDILFHHCALLRILMSLCYFLFLSRYYSGDDPEDAWDMRTALARDEMKQSVIPLDRPVLPQELEW